jgi:histidine triad (HIT) family protein
LWASVHLGALRGLVVVHHRPPVAAAVEGRGERADVDLVACTGHGQDDVAHRDRHALSEERDAQRAIELLRRGVALGTGGMHRLEGREHRHRVLVVRAPPHLPASLGLQRAGDRDLGVERPARGRPLVEELQRERAVLEGDVAVQPKESAGPVQAKDGDMRPRTSDVGVNDDSSPGDLDHPLPVPSRRDPMPRRTTGRRATRLARMCVFCDIASGEASAHVVHEDEHTMAFLDIRPLFPGHCLLIPKHHVETLPELPDELVDPLFRNARLLSRVVPDALGADGSFVAMNNKISQSVPHLHVHVVPRRRKDGLRGFFWPRHKYRSDDEMAGVAETLRVALGAARP